MHYFIVLKAHNKPVTSILPFLGGKSENRLSDLSKVTHLGSVVWDPGHLIPGHQPVHTALMHVCSGYHSIKDIKMVVLPGKDFQNVFGTKEWVPQISHCWNL